MGMSDLLEIAAAELAQILRTPSEHFTAGGSLVLDCRPFLAYSRAHICDSRNVNWNSMLRRRSKSSVVSLEWLVPDRTLLGRLRSGEFSLVIVLDEDSPSVADLKTESLASMLLTALHAEVEAGNTQMCFLQGGFDGFFAVYPDLCVNAPAVSGNNTAVRDPEPVMSGRSTPCTIRRETLAKCGITAVLNVSSTCPNLFEDELHYKTLRVEDSLVANIRACFPEAIDFIDSVKQRGGRVLVHCQAGISRSATICLAYLMHSRRVRLDEAFDFVKQRRRVISPNLAFMGQLLQFETDVLCH
ncbi:hypothetical protein MATL_G00059850 [Megalops atlanticus]|uniref:Protein-serine/threonine phosphatase n=1 Tax=Megalops atlanticus TaxID=7932 RepID=A0A9D3QCD3_MEGAT|nr:hypothetical protein MATL_G00059850 [Megalops atlanticus]